MRTERWRPRDWCARMGALALLTSTAGWVAAVQRDPQAGGELRVAIAGKALAEALPELSERLGHRLEVSPELGGQRVTLLGTATDAKIWMDSLRTLLTPKRDSGVFWSERGGGSTLRPSENHRKLVRGMQDEDLRRYRSFLDEQIRWARKANEHTPAAAPNEPARRELQERLALASTLDALGAAKHKQLLEGEPVVVSPGELGDKSAAWALQVWASDWILLTIVSDGYLRRPVLLPSNLQVRDCPVDRVLIRLSNVWNFDWKYLPGRKEVMLIRARAWWLEDRADIPQVELESVTRPLDGKEPPRLEDLMRLAELRPEQIRKVESLSLIPAAQGMLPPASTADLGARAALRFFGRLAPEQQGQARSMVGLSLASVLRSLVQETLRDLLALYGALLPEEQERLRLRLEPISPRRRGEPASGYRFRFESDFGEGPRFAVTVGTPSGPSPRGLAASEYLDLGRLREGAMER